MGIMAMGFKTLGIMSLGIMTCNQLIVSLSIFTSKLKWYKIVVGWSCMCWIDTGLNALAPALDEINVWRENYKKLDCGTKL